MYIHKIFDLCSIAKLNGIKIPKGIVLNAQMYMYWEAAGRYDLYVSVRADSVEKAIQLAPDWIDDLKR